MAVEITQSKKLHKHAVPVVVALLGLLIVSGVAWYGNSNLGTEKLVARSLVTRVVHVQTGNHGLARFSLHGDAAPAAASLDQSGQTAAQSLGQLDQ
jgi:hypothetical protein